MLIGGKGMRLLTSTIINLVAGYGIALAASQCVAHADTAVQGLYHEIIDPLGIVRGTENTKDIADSADRIVGQLEELEGHGNGDVEQRLEQVRAILLETIGGTDQVIEQARGAIFALEAQTDADAVNLIYTAKCAAIDLLENHGRQAIDNYLSDLAQAHPSVDLLGFFPIVSVGAKPVKNPTPDMEYFSSETAILSDLAHSVTDKSDAYQIVSVYANLIRGAETTECAYVDQPLALEFVREINRLKQMSEPWETIVRPVWQGNQTEKGAKQ